MLSKTGKIAAAVIVVLLLAVYGGGVYYYSSHFPHNTLINHVKVGEMDVTKAEKTFTDDLASHKISLKEKERTEVIDANDVGTVINVGSQISDLQDSMNPWLWFTNLFGSKHYTVKLDVTYDLIFCIIFWKFVKILFFKVNLCDSCGKVLSN